MTDKTDKDGQGTPDALPEPPADKKALAASSKPVPADKAASDKTTPAEDAHPGGPGKAAKLAGLMKGAGTTFLSPLTGFARSFGEHMMLMGGAFRWLFRRPFRRRLLLEQMDFIGVGSMPIVLLVGFFSGAVAALQAINALAIFNQERWVGVTVGISLAEELAPVFTGLMITARAGSGMATELGSMRITEQIDALSTFAVNPVQYLITPRVMAAILMLPVMTMAFNIIGLSGAYIVAILAHDLDFGQVTGLFAYWVEGRHYIKGLIKAAVFGLALSVAACFQGYHVRGGAKEVGLATTRAVVTGSVSILLLDYFLIEILNIVMPSGRP